MDIEKILRRNHPWPLKDILLRLIDAVEHLQESHSCDRHGYELDEVAVCEGRKIVKELDSFNGK